MAGKVYVFDLDGTLYKASETVEKLVDAAVVRFFETKLQINKKEAVELIKSLRERYYYDADALEKEYPFSKKEFLEYICDVDVSSLPQDEKLNKLLQGIPNDKYIITDSTQKHVTDVLKQIGVDKGLFRGIFDGHDMQYSFKCTGKGYEKFLQKYNLSASECTIFEDNGENLRAAKELGFVTIGIGGKISAANTRFCDYVYNDIKEAIMPAEAIFCD